MKGILSSPDTDKKLQRDRIINQWLEAISLKPWSQKPSGDRTSISFGLPEPSDSAKGLVVCAGSEPESTLVAMRTHNWQTAIILLDDEADFVKSLAYRIRQRFKRTVYFWPMSVYGNLRDPDRFIKVIKQGDWHCNITPGSKAQSWQLCRLFSEDRLWSLETKTKKALPITASFDDPRAIPMKNVSIAVVSRVNVAGTYEARIKFDQLKKKVPFLNAMATFVARAFRAGSRFFRGDWETGQKVKIGKDRLICEKVDRDSSNPQVWIKLEVDKKSYKGSFYCYPDSNVWFEEVVAGAFLNAGDKVVTDACVGALWRNIEERTTLTELDAILRWDENFLAISCKLGFSDCSERSANEIAAEAKAKLGRRAIPVLVSVHLPSDIEAAKGHALTTAEESIVVEIAPSLLDQPDILREVIDKAIKSRRTISLEE